jgi:hypothetical protein
MLPVSDMRQVHDWFLHRGLPLVLTRRVRSRALIERSAPMVAGVGAVISLTMTLAELTDGDPDFGYVIRLAVLTLLLIAAPFALYLLHQVGTALSEAGRRSAALLVMALFVFGLPFAASGFSGFAAAEALGFAFVAVLAIWLTYIGFGAIALWAFRFASVQFGALGTLMSRALPLLMLTVLVYFTGELWQLSARMTRQRLWQTIGFLAVVAIVFMVTTIRDEVRALREDRAEQTDPAKLLEDTPLATEAGHQPARTPLSLAEQVNVVAVMVVSQAIQVVFFHRRTVRILPRARHRRRPRRRGRAVVVGTDVSDWRTTLSGNMVRHPRSGAPDHRAHVAVGGCALRAVLHREYQRRPAVSGTVFRPADLRRGSKPGRPRCVPGIGKRPLTAASVRVCTATRRYSWTFCARSRRQRATFRAWPTMASQ